MSAGLIPSPSPQPASGSIPILTLSGVPLRAPSVMAPKPSRPITGAWNKYDDPWNGRNSRQQWTLYSLGPPNKGNQGTKNGNGKQGPPILPDSSQSNHSSRYAVATDTKPNNGPRRNRKAKTPGAKGTQGNGQDSDCAHTATQQSATTDHAL